MHIVLTVIRGNDAGRSIEIVPGKPVIVGRAVDADFSFAAHDTHMSRRHFKVETDGSIIKLIDLGSANQTVVRGAPVRECLLADGDMISAGATLFRLELRAPDEVIHTRYQLPTFGSRMPDSVVPQIGQSTVMDGRVCICLGCGVGYLDERPEDSGHPLCPYCRDEANDHFQMVPGYLLLRLLGRGGMGMVWLAIRESDGKRVAIKTLAVELGFDNNSRARFVREANVLRDLIHPHIVAFHELKVVAKDHYLVMEYVPGQDAARLLAAQGPFAIPRAVDLTCQLLEALDYAHAKGFVHRDIKPSNLMVVRENDREIVKLADFGLARIVQDMTEHGITHSTDRLGTPSFIAPEQVRNFHQALPATDQYATAATLYNLLTNQYVISADISPQDYWLRILEEEPIPIRELRPEVPDQLAAIIHKALRKDPAKRFARVIEMRRALAQLKPILAILAAQAWKSP